MGTVDVFSRVLNHETFDREPPSGVECEIISRSVIGMSNFEVIFLRFGAESPSSAHQDVGHRGHVRTDENRGTERVSWRATRRPNGTSGVAW